MKNMWKYTIVFLLILSLAAGGLTGCKGDGKKKSSGKGRYVEKDIEFPVKEGQEQFMSFLQSKDGNPLLFASNYLRAEIARYEYVDGKWEETDLDWFSRLHDEGMPTIGKVRDVQESDDGTQVLIMQGTAGTPDIICRGKVGSAGEILDIPYVTEKSGNQYMTITNMVIDKEGNYWMNDLNNLKAVVISPDTLETIMEVDSAYYGDVFSGYGRLAKGKDGSIAVQAEDGICNIYDAKSLETKGKLTFEKGEWPALCSDGSNWYAVSEKGISRCQIGSDMTEIMMDGGMGMMGQPKYRAGSVIMGSDDDFYVLYGQNKDYDYSLKHYVYDPDISAVPEKTLTVFGLSDNDTVRQGIQEFQRKNPDVRVDFHTSGKEDSEVTSDDIRTLNTELLSGNGADVLLMDGLPLDAYIEKGTLADLTDFTKELTAEDSYLDNILENTAQKDGRIYALPIKFRIPIMYGSPEVRDALESIDSLERYLDKEPDATVFSFPDHWYIRDLLFQLYHEEIVKTNGKVDQKKLRTLLELEEKICENAGTKEFEERNDITEKYKNSAGIFTSWAEFGIIKHPDTAETAEISSVPGMTFPYGIMRELSLSPVSIQNLYHPVGIVGVNQNSTQKDLAEEFLKFLLSEEVQSVQQKEGLPVLADSMDGLKEELDSTYMNSLSSGWRFETEDGEMEFIAFGYAVTEEELRGLLDMSRTLNKPLIQDRAVWGIYQENAEKYLEGSIDVDEAVETIAQKADTYLAE